jgi:hypothetical protein
MSVIKDINELRTRGYDSSSIENAIEWNQRWEGFMASPVAPFLSYGDPKELWKRPSTPLLDMDSIARNVQELVPDAVLFKFGFLPVWTSIGGNVIAYHPETRAFYWADHECVFGNECVLVPKSYKELPLNFENLMQALIKFSSEECGAFLCNLRDGIYDEDIEMLD